MALKPFSQRLQNLLGISVDDLVSQDEMQVQQTLAAKLRKMAIQHLSTPVDKSVARPTDPKASDDRSVAQKFSQDYAEYATGFGYATAPDFLKGQSKNGAWAFYVELAALAEKLGFNAVVTDVHRDRKGIMQHNAPQPLFKCKNPDAPTIHLTNENYVHWKLNNNTIGDGNCLYNAVAQALQVQAKKEYEATRSVVSKPIVTDRTVASQLASNPPKPAQAQSTRPERIVDYTKVEGGIAKVEKVTESEQIRRDEELARQLQQEEDNAATYRRRR